MWWKLLLVLAICLVPIAAVTAGDAPIDRATLRGVKAVHVVLDPIEPELQKAGLTQTDLQTRLENRLKAADVPIDPSSPEFLGLRVISVRGNRGPFALSFSLGCYQPVLLVRDQNIRSATPTWDIDTVLMTEPKTLHQATYETIDDLADRFVAAWRSVNPR
jgi:hypothetical protein